MIHSHAGWAMVRIPSRLPGSCPTLYLRTPGADMYEAFEGLLLDEESFRDQLKEYAGFDNNGQPRLTPSEVPLLVSQHLPWLRPVARNKMWRAVVTNQAPSGLHEFYGLPERGAPANAKNFREVVIPLLERATANITLPSSSRKPRTGTGRPSRTDRRTRSLDASRPSRVASGLRQVSESRPSVPQ